MAKKEKNGQLLYQIIIQEIARSFDEAKENSSKFKDKYSQATVLLVMSGKALTLLWVLKKMEEKALIPDKDLAEFIKTMYMPIQCSLGNIGLTISELKNFL